MDTATAGGGGRSRAHIASTFGVALVLALGAWGMRPAAASQVTSGFLVEQIDFRDGADSRYGEFTVVRAAINAAAGLPSGSGGYVNVMIDRASGPDEWAVRNLPVWPGSGSVDTATTRFDLGGSNSAIGVDVTSVDLYVDYSGTPSDEPSDFFPGSGFVTASVGSTVYAVGGVEEDVHGHLGGCDETSLDLSFDPNGIGNLHVVQDQHPNVQAANNQCAPAAVANSLQFLENTTNIEIPHDHDPGEDGDDTLVGQLDAATGRSVTDRTNGSGVWPLDGKLKYIADNDLSNAIVVKHYGDGKTGGTPNAALDSSMDLTRHGVTSVGKGAISWAALCQELADGEDVEIDLHYTPRCDAGSGANVGEICASDADCDDDAPCEASEADCEGKCVDGRHYVEVVGCGTILGVPFIQHVSDHAQTDEDATDSEGTDKVDFEWMVGDYLPCSDATVDQAIVQSPPELVPTGPLWPLAALVLAEGAVVLRRRARRRGPAPPSSS
jgi:hypothetical protein